MSSIEILQADLGRPEHQEAVVTLLDAYARDPMGNGKALSDRVRSELIAGLQQHPTTIIFLVFQNKIAVGIATCFGGFSTFAARPLINIHDFYILPEFRGLHLPREHVQQGPDHLGRRPQRRSRCFLRYGEDQLDHAVSISSRPGCCKITLEVQQNNHGARRIYAAAGFSRSVYVEAAGGALFLSKPL